MCVSHCIFIQSSTLLCPLQKTFTQLSNRLHRRVLRGHTYRYKFPVPFGGRLVSKRPERAGVGGRRDTKGHRGRAADRSRVM